MSIAINWHLALWLSILDFRFWTVILLQNRKGEMQGAGLNKLEGMLEMSNESYGNPKLT